VRSASRMGYSDLGVNRKRVEEIRSRFDTRNKERSQTDDFFQKWPIGLDVFVFADHSGVLPQGAGRRRYGSI
jgi:hypothetical protein